MTGAELKNLWEGMTPYERRAKIAELCGWEAQTRLRCHKCDALYENPDNEEHPNGVFCHKCKAAAGQAMTSNLDIYRSAHSLIKQHGEGAAIQSAMKADAMLDKGDLAGAAVWRRIVAAINGDSCDRDGRV